METNTNTTTTTTTDEIADVLAEMASNADRERFDADRAALIDLETGLELRASAIAKVWGGVDPYTAEGDDPGSVRAIVLGAAQYGRLWTEAGESDPDIWLVLFGD